MATSVFRRDYLMRNLVTPASTSKDHLGRLTTSTGDSLGRGLIAELWAGTHAVTAGEYLQITATGIVYEVVDAGTTAAAAPTAPGVGEEVTDGTATLLQVTSG
jgi:hypothetical protein